MPNTLPNVVKILTGHTSPETAYVVDDYPYGFRLRCKIRYWLEYRPNKGIRFCSQTTNPKKAGEVWNKPKESTYARFGGCMFLDENNHVQWAQLSEYCNAAEARAWSDAFRSGVPQEAIESLDHWVKLKEAYEARKATGQGLVESAAGAIIDAIK
jgi:hypothetical protein